MDWLAWHADYDDASSGLTARLRRVQQHLSDALDGAPPGRVRLLSLCAGQGRDVIEVLAEHPRGGDVTATLVELDPRNVADARRRAAGLSSIEVREADASRVATFADVLRADVLLLCGIFGNIDPEDIRRTVEAAPALCSLGATVIWTRHRRPPDQTVAIRGWFRDAGFDEIAFDAIDTDTLTGVGVHRLHTPAAAPPPSDPLFTFRR